MSFVTGISRYILPIITLIIIVKCLLTLLLGQPKEKTYGYIIDSLNGERYPLNMWETSIGRSASCDIVVSYPTVSRFQAVISRRIDGWYIYDLNSKSGIKVNDRKIDRRATIKAGDKLCFGAMNYSFEIINDPVQRVGKNKKKKSPTPVQKPVRRPVASDTSIRNDRLENEEFFGISVNPELFNFYDSKNPPDLHFKKTGLPTDFISERGEKKNVYSSSSHIETPSSSSGRRLVLSKPRITNRDTNETFILSGNLDGMHTGKTEKYATAIRIQMGGSLTV